MCKRDFHHQCAEHLAANCPGVDTRRGSTVRRTSSNSTNSSVSQAQIYTDQDMVTVAQTPARRTKFGKFFNVSISKHSSSKNSPGSTLSTAASKSIMTSSIKNNDTSKSSITSVNGGSPVTPVMTNPTKTARPSQDQTLRVNTRPSVSSQLFIKPNQRKDLKLTNVHEQDGVWIATGQFGRESRRSKRTEILYDKKKFRFTQKDDQGNRHDFEIPVSDIEGKI